jgi:hypothetical protein
MFVFDRMAEIISWSILKRESGALLLSPVLSQVLCNGLTDMCGFGVYQARGSRTQMPSLCNVLHRLSTLERQTPFFSVKAALAGHLLK